MSHGERGILLSCTAAGNVRLYVFGWQEQLVMVCGSTGWNLAQVIVYVKLLRTSPNHLYCNAWPYILTIHITPYYFMPW